MDFLTIRDKFITYAKQQKDANGNLIFTDADFENEYSNISLLSNMLSFHGTIQENKFRLYKENSILQTTSDFNIARKVAKMQNGYNWKRNQGSEVICNITLKKQDLSLVFGNSTIVKIPKLSIFSLSGYKFYNTEDIIFNLNDILNTTSGEEEIVVEGVTLTQGTYTVNEFISSPDLLIVFNEASKLVYEEIFIETDIVDSNTGITTTSFVQYFADEEFLETATTDSGEYIYYTEFFNDNIMYKFNNVIPTGKRISVTTFKNEGYFSNFDTILSGTITVDSAIPFKSDLIFTIDSRLSKNGINAETIEDLKAIGNKIFINEAVNENDYNELLNRQFGARGYKLNAVGGETYGTFHIGYIVFTGLNENNEPLTYSQIREIKEYLDTIKGMNLRIIYRVPTVIALDFDINLEMKLQYRGRYDEFKEKIRTDILNYINEEIYSNPLESTKYYTFNNIYLKEDEIYDYVDKFNVIQTTNYKIFKENINFYNLISQNNSNPADELFRFSSAFTLTNADIYTLYSTNEFQFTTNGLLQFGLRMKTNEINFNYGLKTSVNTDSYRITPAIPPATSDTIIPIYKYIIGTDIYVLDNTQDNAYTVLRTNEDSEGNIISSNLFVNPNLLNDMQTDYVKLLVNLYKTTQDKHYINDITFGRDTFVVPDKITFTGS